MASFSPKDHTPLDIYKLMIGSIVPRPIGFVSSRAADGTVNLSPFSFFNGCTFNPPTLAFTSIDRGSEMKDTAKNIQENPEFIVHIVSEDLAEPMNATCGDYGPHIDEFKEAGLEAVPGTVVNVPRVAAALVAFECKTMHYIRLDNGTPPAASHVIGEIQLVHVADALLDERNRINPDVLKAVGRMGGDEYARTKDRFALQRPAVPPEDPRSIATYKKK